MKNRLLEIALKNNLERHEELDYNIQSILSKSLVNMHKSTLSDLPVEPVISTWQEINDNVKSYLAKEYKFHSTKHMIYFINEGMKKFDEINHHAKLTIEHDTISVELYTNDVNSITTQDLILKDYLEELFDDIKYISRN